MINRYVLVLFLSFSIIVIGCQKNPRTTPNDQQQLDVNLTRLSTNKSIDQTYSNQAKESLEQNNDLTSIKAVNTDDQMVITFEVDHLKRFKLEKIRKKIEKKMKKKFSNLKVLVSTDQKIVIELEKIEKELQTNKMTKKELEKEIKQLMDLAKEQT